MPAPAGARSAVCGARATGPGVALEDLARHARRPDHARLGKLGQRVGEVVRIGGFVAVGGALEPHGVLDALHGIVGPDHPGSWALVVLVLTGLARHGAVAERGAPGPPGPRDDPLVLPGDERSGRSRGGGHHLAPERHRRDAAVSAACRPHALRHLARPGAGRGRRRRERKAGSRRRRLGGEDLLKEALDGALRRGQPRERWALGEGAPSGPCGDPPRGRGSSRRSPRRGRPPRPGGRDPARADRAAPAAPGPACRGPRAPPARPPGAGRRRARVASPSEASSARGSQMCAPSVAAAAVRTLRWRGARPVSRASQTGAGGASAGSRGGAPA